MSIKKEIMEMLADGNGDVKINNISILSYHTEDVLGRKVDMMDLHFKHIVGMPANIVEIQSRDYDGIVSEINEKTKTHLQKCADEAAKNLRSGLRR